MRGSSGFERSWDAPGLTAVRYGRFSGSGISLVAALRRFLPVTDIDVMSFAKSPFSFPWRLAAQSEATRSGGVPWVKTMRWSSYVQRRLNALDAFSRHEALLFIQTVAATVPEVGLDYQIYTDRVGREGARTGGEFRSRFSPGWLARETELLRRAKRVFVMGPSTRSVLVDEYGVERSCIEVVGAGPNCTLGPPVHASECRVFLFVGTQWRLKGGPTLLSAFRRLRTRFPDLELMLVGSQPDGSLPDGVTALGRVHPTRMDNVYSRAHAVVIPTQMEAFGISFLEALFKGLPCVGTSVANQRHIIGDAGVIVEPGSVDALEDGMEKIINSYGDYALQARNRGHELAPTMNWTAIARRIAGND